MVVCLLLIPKLLLAEPDFYSVTYKFNTGPLPPKYYYETTLNIKMDNAGKKLNVSYEKAIIKPKGGKEKFKGELSEVWYDDMVDILHKMKTCQRNNDRLRRLGGSESSITITGKDLGKLSKALRKNLTEVTITPADICGKEGNNWWSKWELFSKDVTNAVKSQSKRVKAPVYKYLRISKDGSTYAVNVLPDFMNRTARVSVNGVEKKPLSHEKYKKFEELLNAPNYFVEGIVQKPVSMLGSGEYIDRGEGKFYSLDKGLADPVNHKGSVENLRKYFITITK